MYLFPMLEYSAPLSVVLLSLIFVLKIYPQALLIRSKQMSFFLEKKEKKKKLCHPGFNQAGIVFVCVNYTTADINQGIILW